MMRNAGFPSRLPYGAESSLLEAEPRNLQFAKRNRKSCIPKSRHKFRYQCHVPLWPRLNAGR
jgi:hypothetical protein